MPLLKYSVRMVKRYPGENPIDVDLVEALGPAEQVSSTSEVLFDEFFLLSAKKG